MDKSKRKLAKALGVAGVGATVWQKPIVDAVALPAHAQTSANYYTYRTEPDTLLGDIGNGTPLFTVCVSLLDDNFAQVTVQGRQNRARRSGIVPLNGQQGDLDEVIDSCGGGLDCSVSRARLTNLTASSITVTHTDGEDCGDNDGWIMNVPLGPCGDFDTLSCPN